MKAGEGYYGFADETASALEATVTHENGSESAPNLIRMERYQDKY